uniref:Protein containing CENP-T C domain n=1 Tax=Rhipicephalus zambeziensis TaxID=60191 RepID=A0A224Y4D1_9ACAR
MPPQRRRAPRGRGQEQTQQSTPSVGEETPQTVQQEPPASTSRGHGHASIGLKASAGRPAPDEQATPFLPPEQSLADCSDGEQHEGIPVPKLPLKRRRGQPPKTKKVAPKQSNVDAPGSSRNPPAALPNEEIQAASPPVNLSQLHAVQGGSAEPSMHVVDRSAASSGAKEMENTRITRSLSKSLEDPGIRKCTVSMGVRMSGRSKEVREMPSSAAAEGPGTKKRSKRRGSPPVAQREVAVTSPAHSSPRGDTFQARNVPTYSSFLMPPEPTGQQRVTRALSKLQMEKGPTNETSEEIHRNVRTVGSVSDQPALSCSVVTKTPRVHQQGKTLDAPESLTDETDPKAGPSSSRLSYRRRLLFEKNALENSTLEKGTRNIQVKTRTSKHQLTSDDAAKASRSTTFHGGQGDAETSSPARKKGSTGEKPARAVPQGVSKTNASAELPPERGRSRRLSAETSHAEAGPSGDKTTRRQKSSQEVPHSLRITASDRQHTSGTQNIQVSARTSKHQLTSDDAAKASRSTTFHGGQGDAETSSPARKKGSTGEKPARAVPQGVSKTNASAELPPETGRSKRLSAETSHAEAGPSGDKTTRRQKSSQEMPHSLRITASDRQHASGTQNIQVSARTSKHQLASDDAAKASRSTTLQGSQGDAESSSSAREKGSTGERTARAIRQGVSKKNASAELPPETGRSKRLSAETSHAEAGPSGDKTVRTQKSSQEMPHSLGITSSDQQHASGSSHSRSRESRRQVEGRGNSPHIEHVPESRAGTISRAPQQRTEREKLRARPRHLWQRKIAQEPVFIVEDREPSRHAPSPISRSKADATLSLSPAPVSVASTSDEGYAGKLGFHWYEATFGALQHGRTDAADDEIESLHWKSDTEECVSENDSSDVDSGEDLSVLPWDNDSRSTQFSKDLEPSQKMQRLDRWQKDARKRVQARLLGVRVTNRAWDTIDKWHSHFLENMGQSVQAMAERVGHNRIEEEDVVWFIHRHLGTADPTKLWALADKLLPAELRDQIYPATKCNMASNDA